jgi:hypothetical protein
MYCPHCSQYIIDIGDFDDEYTSATTESDSWSYDEDSVSFDEPMPEPPARSPLKRSRPAYLQRDIEREQQARGVKRIRTEDYVAPMDVDDDMTKLYDQFNKLNLN